MSLAQKILIADEDSHLRLALSEQLLVNRDFITLHAESAAQVLSQVQNEQPDLIILQDQFADMEGSEIVKTLRRDGYKNPILMLTTQMSDADMIQGYEAGVNDYIIKPFRFALLLSRIRAQIRQHEASDDSVFTIGPYAFRPGAKQLTHESDLKIKLTEKETAILRFLYKADLRVVAKETLLSEVWGYNPNVTTHTLETHIYRLRQKIEDDPTNAKLLVTEAGGYKLVR
ncbi:MAG: DNA-binding response regulator [Methylocystaceae bacterium]|jgi:DNA-binding response OmpR family regulator|nr:DNA-binding response regulator [Methylocystaceae bacterium]